LGAFSSFRNCSAAVVAGAVDNTVVLAVVGAVVLEPQAVTVAALLSALILRKSRPPRGGPKRDDKPKP
jgi:hypothetical protein